MKILILGAGGMIGHKMYQVISKEYPETYACIRRPFNDFHHLNIFDPGKVIDGFDVIDFTKLTYLLDKIKPDIILNCIGVTLRKAEVNDLSYCLSLNSILPQWLKCWSAQNKSYLIHFSTDCVFDGKEESYTEMSFPTAQDNYGRSKYLGEVTGEHQLTLRGSMIGRELHGKTELLEWALAQKNKTIKGYTEALYSGVTTSVMADLVLGIIKKPKRLTGIYQVSSEPISKFHLLKKINSAFQLNIQIEENCSYVSKKILDSSKIKNELGFVCPSWDEMLEKLTLEQL